jgi:hypothetical protein
MVSFEGLGSDLAASARSIALCNGGGVQMRLTGATETANWEVIRRWIASFDNLTSHLSGIYLVVNDGYIINKQDTSQEKLGHPF